MGQQTGQGRRFHGKQQHFNVTNGKLVCFRGELTFSGQNQPKDGFRTLYLQRYSPFYCHTIKKMRFITSGDK